MPGESHAPLVPHGRLPPHALAARSCSCRAGRSRRASTPTARNSRAAAEPVRAGCRGTRTGSLRRRSHRILPPSPSGHAERHPCAPERGSGAPRTAFADASVRVTRSAGRESEACPPSPAWTLGRRRKRAHDEGARNHDTRCRARRRGRRRRGRPPYRAGTAGPAVSRHRRPEPGRHRRASLCRPCPPRSEGGRGRHESASALRACGGTASWSSGRPSSCSASCRARRDSRSATVSPASAGWRRMVPSSMR